MLDMQNVSFLHLSDLHIGDRLHQGIISKAKKVLFEDINYILKKMGTLDVVFFTGDLVQRGSKEEYDLLEIFLNELWAEFDKLGHNPYLLCVPGNHDLVRVKDNNDPTHKVLCNWIKDDIKNDYFWEKPNSYHTYIEERFSNYMNWYHNTSIKKPDNISYGYLPGDFSVSLNINNLKLGVVGLNSSFLQLDGGDYEGKLGIYNNQIFHIFNDKYTEWLEEQNMSVLLTHHSSSWFESRANNEYKEEIYMSESYMEHLCGHMHEPIYTSTSINGFPSKRQFITPSLFGLEVYNNSLSRIHGYTAGIYSFESGKITKTIWPRISIQTKSGDLKISQNEEFNLDKDSASLTETLVSRLPLDSDRTNEDSESVFEIEEKAGNIFSKKTSSYNSIPRTLYKEKTSHLNIRFHERSRAVNNLLKDRYCWITTEYGMAEEEFIGSFLNQANINLGNCFSLNCDEATTINDLMDCFHTIFSLNITKFFDIISSLDRPLLVLNKISEELMKDIVALKEFINTIFDFAPNISIIFVSDINSESSYPSDNIRLIPLDIPGVKQYLENSQDIHCTFSFIEYEKIHRISSGIPLYIDKIIEQLTFRPLSDLADLEFISSMDESKTLSIAIQNEINLLHKDDGKEGSRRFMLLSVLSLLHNGETYERIKRFDSTKPFHTEDISFLLKSKLIETIQVNTIFDNDRRDMDLIKIIKVPRLIRDYISFLLTDEEKINIYKMACDLYLGLDWRNSIKFIQPKDAELDLIIYQNLQIAIQFILSYGIKTNNSLEIRRMTQVSTSLVENFERKGAYKDAVSLTEVTLTLIKDVDIEDFDKARVHLTKSLGENLRMTSFHDKSISILKSICDDENNSLSREDRNDIRLSIAYAYLSQRNENESIKYANLIKKNEPKKKSSIYLSAEHVIAQFNPDKVEKIKALKSIKSKAEKAGFHTLKANITFNLCSLEMGESQIKHLDKIIIESKNNIYNKVRALVVKTDIVLQIKNIEEITNDDLFGLNVAYSYTFYQRLLLLLDKCHNLAWKYWVKQNRYDQLLNLFRYSSFVWRLCGAPQEEKEYLDILYNDSMFQEWFKVNREGINGSYFAQRVLALYNNSKIDSIIKLE